MNRYDLEKQTAVVTGGAQGIGLAIVERFLASDAQVAIWDRDGAMLERCAERLDQPHRILCVEAKCEEGFGKYYRPT